jgi:hypothetical protein
MSTPFDSELLGALFAGTVRKQGRGRPRKGSDRVTWAQLGFTRQQVHRMLKLASIPENIKETYFAQCEAKGKKCSYRGLFRAAGLDNVANEDVFIGTIYGDLADKILQPVERVIEKMDDQQRRCFIRALRYRLKVIADLADVISAAPKRL